MSTAYTIEKEIAKFELRHDTAGVDLAVVPPHKLPPFLVGEIDRFRTRHGLGPVARVAIHRLRAGGSVAPHVDTLDGEFSRHHFPVTAPVFWWDEDNGDMVLEQGRWSVAVPYNRLHSVHNPTDVDRVTIIVDFEVAGD